MRETGLPAEAGVKDWNVVSTPGPLPKDFLRLISDLGRQMFNMDVEVPHSAAGTVFSLEVIGRVMSHLSDWVQNLGESIKKLRIWSRCHRSAPLSTALSMASAANLRANLSKIAHSVEEPSIHCIELNKSL